MNDTYRIVLTGALEPGFERPSVIEGLKRVFRIPSEQAESLLAGAETVIKKDVDADTAHRYEQAVRNTGAACRVVPDAGALPASEPASASVPAPAPDTVSTTDLPPPPVSAETSESTSQDPYAPPAAALLTEPSDEGMHEPRGVGGGRGLGWMIAGAKMFAGAPLVWFLVTLVYGVISIGGSLVPFIGPIAISVLYPVFLGGIMLGADRQHRGEALQFADLFSGFSERLGPLAALGGVYLGGSIAIALVIGGILAVLLGGNALLLAQMAQNGGSGPMMGGALFASVVISSLVVLACLLPLYMALWFAPTLVALHPEIGVGQALAMSFRACARNMLGFLLYGIVLIVLLILAALPFGLGLLVALPIVLASIYISYREIFVE